MAAFHIHVGLPKTGSTTFQNVLHLNGEALSQEVAVINRMCFGVQRRGLLRAHAHMRGNYIGGIDAAILRQHLETAFDGPFAGRADSHPVLITDEGLCGPHPGQFRDHPGVLPALPAALDALAGLFPPERTVFHIVVRQTPAWVKSLYNQAVKQTGYVDSLDAFQGTFPEGFDIEAHVVAFRSAHPDKDIRIHRMEDHVLFPGEQILIACGLAPERLASLQIPERQNLSWSSSMLQAMRVINGADIDEKSRNILRKEIARQRGIFVGR